MIHPRLGKLSAGVLGSGGGGKWHLFKVRRCFELIGNYQDFLVRPCATWVRRLNSIYASLPLLWQIVSSDTLSPFAKLLWSAVSQP